MPNLTGKHAFMESLLAHGAEVIFGNPGTAELPFMDALQDYPQLRYYLGLQESVVVSAADGYARVSGKVGLAQLHITVGLANGIAMLYNAQAAGVPLFVFTGQTPARDRVQTPNLYGNQVEMTRQFTKWSHEAGATATIPQVVRRALREASTAPTGPVFVTFPMDTLSGTADLSIEAQGTLHTGVRPDPQAIQKAAEWLAAASTPLLVFGDGVSRGGGTAQAVALAERLAAPAFTPNTLNAFANFPTDHPQYLGALNTAAPAGRAAAMAADVVLLVGYTPAGSGNNALPLSPAARVIQIDADPKELGRNRPVDLGIQGNPAIALAELVAAIEDTLGVDTSNGREARRSETIAKATARRERFEAQLLERWDAQPISGARLLRELDTVLPADRIVVHETWADRVYLEQAMTLRPGGFHGLTGGAIGWGMGAALGAKVAAPKRPVVGLVGDGSAMYAIQALYTAVKYRIPVVWVIFNNQSYRILKNGMLTQLGEAARPDGFIGMDLNDPPIHFDRIAQSFGVAAVRVERPEEIRPALEHALAAGTPFLVDVVVDGAIDRPF